MSTSAPILVIMGVSGSGKSTVALLLAKRLGWIFAEGDAMHPAANVRKMEAGTPLDDDDRRPWLETIASWIDERIRAGQPAIVTCSALKRRYRDVLRRPEVVFVHLAGPAQLIGSRMSRRSGHFMPTSLLSSQVATLEPPEVDEQHLSVDAGLSPAGEVEAIIVKLGLDRLAPSIDS